MVEKSTIDFGAALNAEQYQVVTQGEGPCLVLAGAGSGKTRTLVYRVAYLLQQGVSPRQILLLTFTNKAAREMLDRIAKLSPEVAGLVGGTFHHVANLILRQYAPLIGYSSGFSILDEEDSHKLIKAALADLGLKGAKDIPKAAVIGGIASLAANQDWPVADVLAERFPYFGTKTNYDIERIIARYQESKRRSNALDFDDLLTLWLKLLRESAAVRQTLQERFRYVLVDEHQDTNFIQSEIIRYLANEQKNILVVGDDAQSIYSFRGADVQNILRFPQEYPGSKIFRLEANYRSTPEILDLANASIKKNQQKFEKELKACKDSGAKPFFCPVSDAYQQAELLIRRVAEFVADGRYELNDIAVLFRSHFQSLELEILLNKYSLPYRLRGGMRFFEQAHLKDIVAYLRVFHNPADQASWLRVLGMLNGIGEVSAQKIYEVAGRYATLEELLSADLRNDLPLKLFTAWREIKDQLTTMQQLGADNVGGLVQSLLKSGYLTYLQKNYENYADRLEDLQQLVVFAGDYQSLEAFLSDVTLSESFEREGAAEADRSVQALTLTTIHQAKGLEWPVIFIIGLVEGQFPHSKVGEHPENLDEERRLFYVAVTRAKDLLYLLYPAINNRTGFSVPVSRFVQELPKNSYQVFNQSLPAEERIIEYD